MKLKQSKRLEIVMSHEEIEEALLDWIWNYNSDLADVWDDDELILKFEKVRHKAEGEGGGLEVRFIVKGESEENDLDPIQDAAHDPKTSEAQVPGYAGRGFEKGGSDFPFNMETRERGDSLPDPE